MLAADEDATSTTADFNVPHIGFALGVDIYSRNQNKVCFYCIKTLCTVSSTTLAILIIKQLRDVVRHLCIKWSQFLRRRHCGTMSIKLTCHSSCLEYNSHPCFKYKKHISNLSVFSKKLTSSTCTLQCASRDHSTKWHMTSDLSKYAGNNQCTALGALACFITNSKTRRKKKRSLH